MNNIFIFILFLLLTIKCQFWWDEFEGPIKDKCNINKELEDNLDNETRIEGYYRFTDFYLCSERKYRVHFLNDDENNWSQEFTACQPVGNCKQYIDGIMISGEQTYKVRINNEESSEWLNKINNYTIVNKSFAGILGKEINCISINGDDYYRSGHYLYACSNEKEMGIRIVEKFFKKKLSNIEYIETPVIYNNQNYNITIQLLKLDKINFKGSITIKIQNYYIFDSDWGGLIGNNIKELLTKSIDINFQDLKFRFERMFYLSIDHGNLAINFIWSKRKIEIDASTKITKDNYSYRGGFRINIYLNDNSELLSKIKIICEIFLKYSGKKSILSIKNLLSDFNSYEKLDIIMNELGIYSNMVEGLIFFVVLEEFIKQISI